MDRHRTARPGRRAGDLFPALKKAEAHKIIYAMIVCMLIIVGGFTAIVYRYRVDRTNDQNYLCYQVSRLELSARSTIADVVDDPIERARLLAHFTKIECEF